MKKEKMTRVVTGISLILILVIVSFLASCSATTSTPSSTSKPLQSGTTIAPPTTTSPIAPPTTASTPGAAAKTIILKAVSNAPIQLKAATEDVIYGKFIDAVNERAKGQLRIDYLGSTEVFQDTMQFNAAMTGVVDIVRAPGSYHQSIVPEAAALGISALAPWEEREVGFWDLMTKAYQQKSGTIPLGRADYGTGSFYLFTNVKVQKLDDFKGLKFRSSAAHTPFLKSLGMTTVEMPSEDVYTSLERNLIQGYPYIVFISRMKLNEVTKYRVEHPYWSSPIVYVINQKSFASLPLNLQKLLTDTAIEMEKVEIPKVAQTMLDAENKAQLDAKMQFIKLPDADAEKYLELAAKSKWDLLQQTLPADEFNTIKNMIGTKKK